MRALRWIPPPKLQDSDEKLQNEISRSPAGSEAASSGMARRPFLSCTHHAPLFSACDPVRAAAKDYQLM